LHSGLPSQHGSTATRTGRAAPERSFGSWLATRPTRSGCQHRSGDRLGSHDRPRRQIHWYVEDRRSWAVSIPGYECFAFWQKAWCGCHIRKFPTMSPLSANGQTALMGEAVRSAPCHRSFPPSLPARVRPVVSSWWISNRCCPWRNTSATGLMRPPVQFDGRHFVASRLCSLRQPLLSYCSSREFGCKAAKPGSSLWALRVPLEVGCVVASPRLRGHRRFENLVDVPLRLAWAVLFFRDLSLRFKVYLGCG